MAFSKGEPFRIASDGSSYIYQCQASGNGTFILKLDFAKAFDTIEHAAMLNIMKAMQFDHRWLGWIKRIFGSGVSWVLLNGVPGK